MSNTTSRLLTLPAELRSHIWELALLPKVAGGSSTVHGYALTLTKWDEDMRIRQGEKVQGTQPSITRVNRQLRSETLPMFYNLNTFEVEHHMRDRANSWFTTQGESAAHIRSLYVRYDSWSLETVHVRIGDCNGVIPSSAISIVCELGCDCHGHSTALLSRWRQAVEALAMGIRGILGATAEDTAALPGCSVIIDKWHDEPGVQPPITRVNRQIRNETLSMFYNLNTFIVDTWPRCPPWRAVEWLATQGESAAHLRSVYARQMTPSRAKTVHVLLRENRQGLDVTVTCEYQGRSDHWTAVTRSFWDSAVEAVQGDVGAMFQGMNKESLDLETWQDVLDRLMEFFEDDLAFFGLFL
ncbi:hypothetical protein LTR17_015086 [Elasticomyces elasticus]|nr:hypothetical protein LTR17_015086 [Elasticomyces elasticus]